MTTVINLLDWDEETEEPSPLATSKGWVDIAQNADGTLVSNPNVTIVQTVNGVPVTSNGLPMSNDFDLAVYVKGDRKATAVFNARLEIDYEGEEPVEPPADFDVALTKFEVPERITVGESGKIGIKIDNSGPGTATGTVGVVGTSNRGEIFEFSTPFSDLAAGQEAEFEFDWTVPTGNSAIVRWVATVVAEGDTNSADNTADGKTQVRR